MANKTKNYLLSFSLLIICCVILWLVAPQTARSENSHEVVTHEVEANNHETNTTEHSEKNINASSSNEEHSTGGHNEAGEHHSAKAEFLTPEVSSIAWFPLYIIFLPLLGGILYLLAAKQNYTIRSAIMVGTTSAVFLMMISLYKYIIPGIIINGQLFKGIYCSLPFLPNFNFTIKIDPTGYAVAMVSSFVWLIVSIYNIDYMTIEKKVNRFNFFTIITLTAQLGVMLAGDFLTLFLFFEGLVIFPYSMVAHHEDKEALLGANILLYMSVATGLCLLFGMIVLHYTTGTIEIKAMGDILKSVNPGWLKYFIVFLLVFGFGGKAGLFFEHCWLPKAHPVAPTPGSALLSGLMIKAGAYGILRSVNLLYSPGSFALTDWINMVNIGYVLIWVGVITMFLGIMNALLSDNSKRMLAYSSISQMGYIIVGIGCAAYLGKDGAMGLAGAIYHIINHALFKSLLFMGVGAAYFRTHELNMYKLGGLWRNMPIVAFTTLIAALGYGGVPLFNGFASKTLIHHAIIEAYQHSVHYSIDGRPDSWLRIAEIMFMITAGAGLVAVLKMVFLTFFGKRQAKHEKLKDVPLPMKISMLSITAAILFIGLNPNWMLEKIVGPALSYFNFDPASHPYHIIYNIHGAGNALKSTIPILYNPVTGAFISSPEAIHNILGGSTAILLGGVIFILGFRFGWFKLPDSKWITVEFYYINILNAFKQFCSGVIVEESEWMAEKEVGFFRKNYESFVKFCQNTIPDVQGLETSNKIENSYDAIVDLCQKSLPDVHGLETSRKLENSYDAVVNLCDKSLPNVQGLETSGTRIEANNIDADREAKNFNKNYDAVRQFFSSNLSEIQPSLNNALTIKEASIPEYHGIIALLRKTIGNLTYQLNRLVVFSMVEMWLSTSNVRSVYKRFDDTFATWYGGELVIDKKLADIYLSICDQAMFFDSNFVDGMVNGVAWFIHTYGRALRRIQTGYIQNYALSIVIGVVAIVTLCIFIM